MKKKLTPPALIESVFDLAYLVFAIAAGLFLLRTGGGNPPRTLYGALALVLGCGDAFHLLPRVYGQLTGRMAQCTAALGLGKLVTSVTMTVFYILLYFVSIMVCAVPLRSAITAAFFALAAARILLCLCPQNRWFIPNPPLRWSVWRNIPFLAMGIMIIVLFAGAGAPFRALPLAVALSFLFYLPVVLFSQRFPPVGALMLPKTMAYVWIITMGFAL